MSVQDSMAVFVKYALLRDIHVEPWTKGVELNQKAPQEVGGKVIAPLFTDEERAKGTDEL